MTPLRVVLASNNAGKLAELRALLGSPAIELVPQRELGIAEADEPHLTFIENALAKARHAAAAARGAAIADDSGLVVPALAGAPGVASAVYAAHPAAGAGAAAADVPRDVPRDAPRQARRAVQDAANNALLLDRLQGQGDRRAYFVGTLVALRHAADPEPLVAIGRWSGEILEAPRGQGGFGYDPLLFIPALGRSVAELPPETKNLHSHRAQAAARMRRLMAEVWLA